MITNRGDFKFKGSGGVRLSLVFSSALVTTSTGLTSLVLPNGLPIVGKEAQPLRLVIRISERRALFVNLLFSLGISFFFS